MSLFDMLFSPETSRPEQGGIREFLRKRQSAVHQAVRNLDNAYSVKVDNEKRDRHIEVTRWARSDFIGRVGGIESMHTSEAADAVRHLAGDVSRMKDVLTVDDHSTYIDMITGESYSGPAVENGARIVDFARAHTEGPAGNAPELDVLATVNNLAQPGEALKASFLQDTERAA